ncbi:hypothetical protein [Spirosoma spitsbergense]|uniref:hypothetical protein n=1 Tax=Spirosoma spitsbergense TaxID=431554 RepID=UPI000362C276|nr:hypothetical protein [Spirosoma spitsbergense]
MKQPEQNHTGQLTTLFVAGCLWLICTLGATGQNINRQMVNRLLNRLKNSKADTSRLSVLLELGKFHIYKAGETKTDLDSDRFYLDQAKTWVIILRATLARFSGGRRANPFSSILFVTGSD